MIESIRALYRIGFGSSSNYTMGPSRAARLFRQKFPRRRLSSDLILNLKT